MSFAETAANNWRDFKRFMWNTDTGEFAGRSGKSWAEIGIFYIVFYGLLTAWWGGHLYVATILLPELEDGPKLNDYLIHRGPGLHLVPQWETVGTDRQRIYYLDDKSIENYVEEQENFLKAHQNNETFKGEDFGGCAIGKLKASWDAKKPCFFMYFNAIHGFKPEQLDKDSPVTIKCSARDSYKTMINKEETQSFPDTGMDVEKFPWKYGVLWDQTAPVIAAQIAINEDNFKKEVRITCKARAKNIFLDAEKPNIGQIEFRIKSDKSK